MDTRSLSRIETLEVYHQYSACALWGLEKKNYDRVHENLSIANDAISNNRNHFTGDEYFDLIRHQMVLLELYRTQVEKEFLPHIHFGPR